MNGIWVNGTPGGQLDALDRGLHYGDGVFETIAVIDRTPLLMARHMSRLLSGCQRLEIPLPDHSLLMTDIEQALASCPDRAILKVILTRGAGGRGYRFPPSGRASRIVTIHDWPDYPSDNWRYGVKVRVCATRLGRQPALAGIKHLNRLEQVLARNEWTEEDVAEGLMCDENGRVVEGTMSNIFFRFGDCVVAPIIDGCGVAGVMRGEIMEKAADIGLSIVERQVTLEEAVDAEEWVICNSVFGVWPVRQVAGIQRKPGFLFAQLEILAIAAGFDRRLYNY